MIVGECQIWNSLIEDYSNGNRAKPMCEAFAVSLKPVTIAKSKCPNLLVATNENKYPWQMFWYLLTAGSELLSTDLLPRSL